MDQINQATGLGAIPITVLAIQAIKRTAPDAPGLTWVVLALIIPILLNLMIAYFTRSDLGIAVTVGTIAGFGAMAAYDKVGSA